MIVNHKASRERKKEIRSDNVRRIVVTVDGIDLDGDEDSQNRMTRAITGLEDNEQIPWMCADNVVRQLTKEQLRTALRAAGAIQTEHWFNV